MESAHIQELRSHTSSPPPPDVFLGGVAAKLYRTASALSRGYCCSDLACPPKNREQIRLFRKPLSGSSRDGPQVLQKKDPSSCVLQCSAYSAPFQGSYVCSPTNHEMNVRHGATGSHRGLPLPRGRDELCIHRYTAPSRIPYRSVYCALTKNFPYTIGALPPSASFSCFRSTCYACCTCPTKFFANLSCICIV